MNSVESLIKQLKPFLPQYLTSTGTVIRNDGKFLCPSPEKHDTDPSATFLPNTNNTEAYCHSCKRTMDILTVANWTEGLPLKGREFVYQTLYTLARRFGVPFDIGEMSPDDIERVRLKRICMDAFEVLRSYYKNREHIKKRGWSEVLCYQMGVATVTSWADYIARLQGKRGYTKTELERAGIKPQLFHQEGITFTLFDGYGSPVGFALRDMRHNKANGVPKYLNTSSTLIYSKKEVVYGLHRARGYKGPITIVEGYADVLTAMECGLEGVVAICGSKPTQEQIRVLEEASKRDIILALDHDVKPGPDGRPTGQARTEDFIKTYIEGRRSVRIRVADWNAVAPEGKMDLDSLLRGAVAAGSDPAAAWAQIPKVDGFDWHLRLMEDREADTIAEKMIPLVASEPVHARQEVLLQKLAKATGIRLEALQRDLDAALDLQARKTRDAIQRVMDKTLRDAQIAKPEELEQLLSEAHSRVKTIIDTASRSRTGIGNSIEYVGEVFKVFEDRPDGVVGLLTGIPEFDDYMSGLCNGMWVFGGFPNTGKSSLCAVLSWNMVTLNEEAIVLVMTIDDTVEEYISKMMAYQTQIPIREIVHPRRYLKNDPDRMAKYEAAKQNIMNAMGEGRLEIRDASMGTSTSALERWVDQVRKKNPDKKIAVWLDNFHCLTVGDGDIRIRFTLASKKIKALSVLRSCFVGVTAELGKNEDRRRPSRKALKETGSIEYDATGVVLVHNDLDVDPETDRAVSYTHLTLPTN